MKSTIHKPMRTIAIAAVLFAVGYVALERALNPRHVNHIVIVRQNPAEFTAPFQATLTDGETIRWSITLDLQGTRPGSREDASLTVVNIPRAWIGDRVRITDSKGAVVADAAIRPRGRYLGALVILIDEQGQSHTAFNAMPEIRIAE